MMRNGAGGKLPVWCRKHTHGTPLQWCIAKNGGGYTQRGVAKGLKVPCLFMISEVSIRCQKNTEVGIRRIPAYTPPIHHCSYTIHSWLVRALEHFRDSYRHAGDSGVLGAGIRGYTHLHFQQYTTGWRYVPRSISSLHRRSFI